jgi:hypothetical protein
MKMQTEPFIDGPLVGYKCTRSDGEVSYVYLNPSNNPDEKDFDIFVYTGTTKDIEDGLPECFIVPYFTPNAEEQELEDKLRKMSPDEQTRYSATGY